VGRRQRRREATAVAGPAAASAPDRNGSRFGISLAWTVVMVLIVAILVAAGLLLGAELYEQLHHHSDGDQSWIVPVGGLAGALLGISICHLARGWVQRLRLSRLRRTGVAATGHVVARLDEYASNPRGPGMTVYRVTAAWTDEAGPQMGERRYRFWGRGDRAFEALTERGAEIRIRYPSGRPQRFVIDIPYAPTMADQFL
jgi:hypothetical protein